MNKVDEAKLFDMASVAATISVDSGMIVDEGMYMDPGMETGMAEVKDPLLSSWPFVLGVSGGVLIISVALGAFLARRKIKKGIDLYED
jgi:hypothetical protein